MSHKIFRNQTLEILENLLPAVFEKVVFHTGAPDSIFPKNQSQSQKAMDLIKYFEGQNCGLTPLLLAMQNVTGIPCTEENTAGNLVYFLANRCHQEHALRKALKNWHPQENKPFVCIFYGQDKQHDRFMERLLIHFFKMHQWRDLPSEFKDMGNGIALRLQHLQYCPLNELDSELNEYLQKMQIAEKLRREQQRLPVLHFEMSSLDWKGWQQRNLISEFICYWQHNDLINQNQRPPLIFLCFHCLPHFFSLKRFFSTRWLSAQTKLDAVAFEKKFGLPGVVLPELQNIERYDVDCWVDMAEVQALHPNISTATLKMCLETHLYSQQKSFPMRELGVKLEQIIARCRFPQGITP